MRGVSQVACLGCLSTDNHVSFQAASPQTWAAPLSPVSAQRRAGPEPCVQPPPWLLGLSQGCLPPFTVGLRKALPDP